MAAWHRRKGVQPISMHLARQTGPCPWWQPAKAWAISWRRVSLTSEIELDSTKYDER
jgi:hypothetical protein